MLLSVMPVIAQTNTVKFQSSPAQTALLELYTSEGCSSCPPAENWLNRLKSSPGLWTDFVPMAFHVDYWDRLGWSDPWAGTAFTDRQRSYTKLWRSHSLYTPAFVLNGKEWRDWSEHQEAPGSSIAKPGALTVNSSDSRRWQVSFDCTNTASANYEVHAALLGGNLNSDVKAGENRGRHLTHEFVVLSLVNARLSSANGIAKGEFILPASTNAAAGERALAVWITESGHLESLQATGGWLHQSASGH